MRCASLVKMTSGITANDSCRLNTTWLSTSRLPVLLLAKIDDRDERRDQREQARDQAAQPRRQPDVNEAFHHDLAGERRRQRGGLPDASSASANSVLATDTPSSGDSSR